MACHSVKNRAISAFGVEGRVWRPYDKRKMCFFLTSLVVFSIVLRTFLHRNDLVLHLFAPNLSSLLFLTYLSNLSFFASFRLFLTKKTKAHPLSLFQLTPMITVNLPLMHTKTLLRFLRNSARVNTDFPKRRVPLILQYMTRITAMGR